MKKPNALLINPWIYDFAAHDLWLKPLGLLEIAGILRKYGWGVKLVDCLDRNYPGTEKYRSDEWGCGKYYREEVEKPNILRYIPRKYKRYGIPVALFEKSIENYDPDIILVSSGMTYWYPGAFLAIEILKRKFKGIPVLLGGIYATLCTRHATENSGAVVAPGSDLAGITEKIHFLTKQKFQADDGSFEYIIPAYDLYARLDYAALRTSFGCPFRCSYCASSILHKNFMRKRPEDVIGQIEYFYRKLKVKNFAFYDDALLFDADKHIIEILGGIADKKMKCFMHTPNGLHARFISPKLAFAMKKANFISPHLSLETADESRQSQTGSKITNKEFATAVRNLYKAGYRPGEITSYIMAGMPGQPFYETEESIRFVNGLGLKISLCEYSPIPGTQDWNRYKFDLPDPLLHNNSIFPLHEAQDMKEFQKLKDLVHQLNAKINTD